MSSFYACCRQTPPDHSVLDSTIIENTRLSSYPVDVCIYIFRGLDDYLKKLQSEKLKRDYDKK